MRSHVERSGSIVAMQEPGVTRDGNSEDARNRCGRSKDGQAAM